MDTFASKPRASRPHSSARWPYRHCLERFTDRIDTAYRLGLGDRLITQCFRRLYTGEHDPPDADPNDPRHRMLISELASALFVHHMEWTGWGFAEWEPAHERIPGTDVVMAAPNGTPVLLQENAPDQPGRRANYRIVDGEYDDRIVRKVHPRRASCPAMATR